MCLLYIYRWDFQGCRAFLLCYLPFIMYPKSPTHTHAQKHHYMNCNRGRQSLNTVCCGYVSTILTANFSCNNGVIQNNVSLQSSIMLLYQLVAWDLDFLNLLTWNPCWCQSKLAVNISSTDWNIGTGYLSCFLDTDEQLHPKPFSLPNPFGGFWVLSSFNSANYFILRALSCVHVS